MPSRPTTGTPLAASSPLALPAAVRRAPSRSRSQSRSPSIPRTPGGARTPTPVLKDAVFGVEVVASLLHAGAGGEAADDTCEQLCGPLFAATLSRGLETPAGCSETAVEFLNEMLQDHRSHRELGSDPTLSLEDLVPLPFAVALSNLASHHGWSAEAIMQAFVSNVNWLEHEETVLRETDGDSWFCSPPIAMFGGAPPSSRKNSLAEFSSRVLLGVHGAPPHTCTCGFATERGFHNCIASNGRAGLVSPDISSVYDTGDTMSQTMRRPGKGKTSTQPWTQTGVLALLEGSVPGLKKKLRPFAFLHQVWGTFEALERVLSRADVPFREQFNVTWCSAIKVNRGGKSDGAEKFLCHFMEWMCRHALRHKSEHSLDPGAFNSYQGFLHGIRDFLTQQPHVDIRIRQKLGLARTDILRLANVAMRMSQFAESGWLMIH